MALSRAIASQPHLLLNGYRVILNRRLNGFSYSETASPYLRRRVKCLVKMIDPIENDKINELARNAVSGDGDSFRELVLDVTPRIERFLHRHGASPEDAEDVAQEVWLRVAKALGRYDPQRGFLTWIFVITKRAWIDCLRKRLQTPPSTTLTDQPLGNPEQTSVDALEQLVHCLEGLCEEYRTIIRLRYGSEGLSLEQIAQRLGESYGSVRAKSVRAVNQLLDCVGFKNDM